MLSRRDDITDEQIEKGLRELPIGYADSLWFPSRSHDAATDRHAMQKPEALAAWFIEKHTYKGELCEDLCGCSGSFTIAAGLAERGWMYSELDPTNYAWGVTRIANALKLDGPAEAEAA